MNDTHFDLETIQRLAHQEPTTERGESIHDHLTTCASCRARIEQTRHEDQALAGLLTALDHGTPAVRAADLVATARTLDRSPPRWLRRAAIIALSVGIAGAAWALPGSPVREWIDAAITRSTGAAGPTPAPGPVQTAPPAGGLRMAPGESLIIVFTAPRAGASLRVSLIDGDEAEVEAFASGASFDPDPDAGRLLVDNATSTASFEIRIPRDARRVEIRVREQTVFLKDGGRITTGVTPVAGQWTLPLGGPAGGDPR